MKHTLLMIFVLGVVTAAHGQTPTRTLAVTIDDLPFVNIGEGNYVERARPVTAKILSVLKKHKAPAVAFVNEHMLQDPRNRDQRHGPRPPAVSQYRPASLHSSPISPAHLPARTGPGSVARGLAPRFRCSRQLPTGS